MAKIEDLIGLRKDYVYDIYKNVCQNNYEDYDTITRKKMIESIIDEYSNPYFFINALTADEILFVRKNLNNVVDGKMAKELRDLLIYSMDSDFKYTLTEELKPYIKKALTEYKENKKKYEEEKVNAYFLVGLFRAYGVLKTKEIEELSILYFSNKYLTSYLLHPYVQRFVERTYFDSEDYALKELVNDTKILKSHGKKMKTIYDYNRILSIGKFYFDSNNKNYIKLKNDPDGEKILDLVYKDFYIYAGYGQIDYYMSRHSYDFYNVNDYLLYCLNNLLEESPCFILNDAKNAVVDKKVTDLFYSVFPKFLKFSSGKYNMDIGVYDSIDSQGSFELLEKIVRDKFDTVNDFISSTKLSCEQKDMLISISKGIMDNFFVIKHLKDGTIFTDSNENLYLVKGLISELKSLINLCPAFINTLIFEYRGQYICCGLINQFPVKLGPNIQKRINALYKANKDKMIGEK